MLLDYSCCHLVVCILLSENVRLFWACNYPLCPVDNNNNKLTTFFLFIHSHIIIYLQG